MTKFTYDNLFRAEELIGKLDKILDKDVIEDAFDRGDTSPRFEDSVNRLVDFILNVGIEIDNAYNVLTGFSQPPTTSQISFMLEDLFLQIQGLYLTLDRDQLGNAFAGLVFLLSANNRFTPEVIAMMNTVGRAAPPDR